MWFKMGLDILNSSIMSELGTAMYPHENRHEYRKLVFIYLLSITATGGANDLQDAADLARLVDTTPKQAQIVWDVCIKHGVLRQTPQGYSARPWMIERGILGDFERKHRKTEQQQPQPPQPQRNPFQKRDSNDFG